MNKREKILLAATGLVAMGFVTYMAINRVFLLPAAQRFNQAEDLVNKINEAHEEKRKEPQYRARLKALADRTFGADELRVSEEVRACITGVLAESGLSSDRLSLKPLVGSRVPGVYKEIGWLVRARGNLGNVINFLYLMSREPHLHRLDNVMLSPVQGGSDVDLQVKYATLVLEAPKGETLHVTGMSAEDAALPGLDTPERQQYQVIAYRDLFRPYIPAPPSAAPAERRPDMPQPPAPPQAPQVPVGRYKVVGLPEIDGKAQVLVRDNATGQVATYGVGDDLAGGRIVLVDYRLLPLPNRPEILSGSRVVIQDGNGYHAVELGMTLSEKHAMPQEQLPSGLSKSEPAAPEAPSAAPEGGAP
jgi:hypothetical protein